MCAACALAELPCRTPGLPFAEDTLAADAAGATVGAVLTLAAGELAAPADAFAPVAAFTGAAAELAVSARAGALDASRSGALDAPCDSSLKPKV